jgi:hypothetical protein
MSYRPYTSASAFNKTIPSPAPIHPDTAKMISTANYFLLGGTQWDSYKEWMGPGFRVGYCRADASKLPKVVVYANNNGWVGAGPFSVPMPTWMAGAIGPTCEKGDSNVSVVDSVTGDVWELWHATPPGYTPRDSHDSLGKAVPANRWNASGVRHWPAATTNTVGYGALSKSYQPGTSGSKLQLTLGLLVPDDFTDCWSGKDPGTVIPHALRMDTFCGALDPTKGGHHPLFVAPARGGDGRQAYGIPAGGRIQLDPSLNIANWPSINAKPEPWRSALKKICRTLQQYGIIQVDSFGGPGGGDIDAVTNQTAKYWNSTHDYVWPWDKAGFPWGKNGVPYDLMGHFRVIDWTKWTGV